MSQLFQQQKRALGSDALLSLVTETAEQADRLFAKLWESIDQFEARFSRFKPDSELSKVNAAAGSTVPISSEFHALLSQALSFWRDTDGMYNPAILPALEAAGYDRSFEQLAPDDNHLGAPSVPLPAMDCSAIRLTDNSVWLPATMRLDFGGIGKGYLLDQLGHLLKDELAGFWLSLGGDLLLFGTDASGKAWNIGIQNPWQPTADYGLVPAPTNQPLAIATSGTFKRQGVRNGTPWHHLIDPQTGQPAKTDAVAATVIGPEATAADIYASCCVIAGTQEASRFLRQHPGYSGLLFPALPGSSPLWLGTEQYTILDP